MDSIRERQDDWGEPEASALAFAAFVFAHAGCDAGMEEDRLDGRTLACRCTRCDETRVFRSALRTVPE